jgi:hypothetical protein
MPWLSLLEWHIGRCRRCRRIAYFEILVSFHRNSSEWTCSFCNDIVITVLNHRLSIGMWPKRYYECCWRALARRYAWKTVPLSMGDFTVMAIHACNIEVFVSCLDLSILLKMHDKSYASRLPLLQLNSDFRQYYFV